MSEQEILDQMLATPITPETTIIGQLYIQETYGCTEEVAIRIARTYNTIIRLRVLQAAGIDIIPLLRGIITPEFANHVRNVHNRVVSTEVEQQRSPGVK